MIATYEQRLNSDVNLALREGSMHFEEKSAVHDSLHRIATRLQELKIPHAVVGGMALFYHGFRRFTEDVDILVTRSALEEIHRRLDGLGWIPPFQGSKNLRDAETGVKVEFLVTGEYPGDGKPKPVSFPDPADVAVEIGGVSFASVAALVELKLASGISSADRLKDLGDVQEVIRHLRLPRDLGNQINPYVRDKYFEIWDATDRTRSSDE